MTVTWCYFGLSPSPTDYVWQQLKQMNQICDMFSKIHTIPPTFTSTLHALSASCVAVL